MPIAIINKSRVIIFLFLLFSTMAGAQDLLPPIPILCYHNINENPTKEYDLRTRQLAGSLVIKTNGYYLQITGI
ncbi:hypothetical protein A4D02_34920 [Niastella koreensis]|uniref:Uncharacterized protein n=1 Tax=Niastella koreensis TaxID=354356 RepID=A0ABX3NSC7_9BACT|nr:hypothetical protein [Niastella koreensis]OQP44418.1 hypothetical protein A4D02_34920 [Niastella koreensis]